MDIAPNQVTGHWVEIREEGSAGRIVLRPESSDIPPARGRRNLVLEPGGVAQDARPGPDDRPAFADAGTWRLDGSRLTIQSGQFAGSYRVEAAGSGRLVLVSE